MKKLLLIVFTLGCFSQLFAQNQWNGQNGAGNLSYCNNWYGGTCPSTWNSGTDFDLNYNNSNETSLYHDLGYWPNCGNIEFASTFSCISGFPFNGNGNGFNFYGKVENSTSSPIIINIPLSGKNTLELDPTGADLTFNNPVYNDNSNNINVYGSNSHVLYLNNYIVGSSSNYITIQQYSKVAIGYNMASQTTAFGGGVNVNIGELWFMSGGTLNGGTVTVGNGTSNVAKVYINVSGGGTTVSNAITVPSSSSNSYIGGLNTSGINTYSGGITLNGPATFEVNSSGTLTLSGVITGAGNINVGVVGGSGSNAKTLFTNSNTYTGTTTINTGGMLYVSADNNLGTAPGSVTANDITLNGGTLADTTSGFTLNTNRGITLNTSTASNIDVASGLTLNWGGAFSGTGTLTKLSAGTFNITATAGGTYGGLTVATGVVRLAGTANTQMLGNVTVNSGATLRMGLANQFGNGSTPPFLTINGTFDATDNTTGNYSQNIAIQGTGAVTMGSGTLTINNTGTDTYSGTITGTGGLIKGNTGTEILSGANTSLTGSIQVQQGILQIGNANAINSTNAVTLGSGTNSGTLSLSGNNITVTSITTSGTGTTNTINNNNSTTATLTTNITAGDTYSGILANGATGTLNLTKTGTDTLTLSGANTYTGTTTITAGTLKLGASNTIASGSQLVMNGGTLSTNSFSESAGTLNLTANSEINITNSGTSHTLTISNSSAVSWTGGTILTIYHWIGTPGPSGGATGTNDKIQVGVGGLTVTQLAHINFSGYATGAAITGSGELVPAVLTISGISVAAPGSCSSNCSGYVGNTITISGSNLSTVVTVKVGSIYSTATNISSFTYNSGANTITFNAVPLASGYIFVSDGTNTASSVSTYTDLGYYANTAGNWSTTGTWLNGSVPPSTPASAVEGVTIAANVTLNQAATVSSLTIASGTFTSSDGSARTLTIRNNTTATTLTNSGTWANGTGASTVVFAGSSGTQTISGMVGFYNVNDSTTLNPGTASTINGTLTLEPGGSIATNPVAYGGSATLYYNEGGGSGAKINTTVNEWPNTGAVNVYIDNNTWIQIASGKTLTGNVYVNSGALQSYGSNTLTMNKSGTDTITVKNGNATPGAIYGTDNGFGNDLTLTIASGNTTVFTGDAAGASNDDNKKFETVNVNGTLRLQRGIVVYYGSFNVAGTGTLQIDANGYVQSATDANSPFPAGVAPTYSSGALLKYNSNTTYGRGLEWSSTSGAGYPYNVELSNNTTLDLGNGAPSTARQCAGNLTIDNGSVMSLDVSSMTAALTVLGNVFINGTLTLSSNGSGGGDIKLGGNWYRSASTGTFTNNGRAVFFIGSNNQYVTVQGGGTETFAFLRNNISTTGKYLKPNNNLPDTTNITINGTSTDVLDFNSNGSLDINGRRVNIDHNNSSGGTPAVWIYVPSAITITDSAGLYNGEFKFMSSANPNQATWFTCSVHNNSGTGSLTFDNTVLISIADGQADFGLSGSTYLTTIDGTLQVRKGGSVGQGQNSCIYGVGSTLLFANDVDYQVPSADRTWAAGAVTSGLPGIPYNVSVKDVGTNLTINSPRAVRGSISINNDTLTLNPTSGNTFSIGGNWTRTGALSCFKNNAVAKVLFNGSMTQTITCTANSNTETFRELGIANSSSGGVVSLSGSTSLVIADSLILTQGVLTTGSNQIIIPDTCIIKAGTGNTNYSVSWVNGTIQQYFNNGSSGLLVFPLGTATNGCLATVNSNSMTFTGGTPPYYFTASFAGPLVKTGNNVDANLTAYETSIGGLYHTAYTSVNGAGSWKIEPTTGATIYSGTYDVSLYFGGAFTGLADNEFGILKRPVSPGTNYNAFKPYGGTISATNGAGRTVAGGYALRMGLASFSEFVIAEAGTVLPITLVSFTGQNEGPVNNLAWTTATESNTDYFSIQRSSDANTFAEIGTVKAAGFSVNNLNYSFVDDNPAQGINYYKLGTVDQDGQISYSDIIAISTGQIATNTVVVYPNPVVNDITFDVNMAASATVNYTLTDVLGRTIQTGQLSTSAGINHFQLPGSQLLHGVYFLNVSNTQTGLFKTTRLIKAD